MMNTYVAELVDELFELGIEDIVLSPGSRSTPLAILFCEHKFNIYMDIDERSAAFFALGLAKAKKKAVVLVCTSGSACGHYLPAAMEAKHSRIPLIFLTADRPPELQNVGAPQTLSQNNVFGSFVKYYEELAISTCPAQHSDNAPKPSYARLVMQKAFIKAHASPQMAVHINVPLREPLVPDLARLDFSKGRYSKPFTFMAGQMQNVAFVEYFFKEYFGKKGIMVAGPNIIKNAKAYYCDLIKLSSLLHAPILADPLSQFRAFGHENIITSYQSFLKNRLIYEQLKADYIILIGQSPVSKNLFQFLQAHQSAEVFQLDTCDDYRNPALNTTKVVQVCEWYFAKAMLKEAENTDCTNYDEAKGYLLRWQEEQQKMSCRLAKAKDASIIFEGKILQLLQDVTSNFTRQHENVTMQLVVANSMAIRHMDLFWQAREQEIAFYGNRGVNGIDGTISTALGIAAANKKLAAGLNPTVLICGDLAFFHDLTGLLVGIKSDINLTIILFNNNGGGIFQYLPQASVQNFEYLFLTPHGLNFSALAQLYQLNYQCISDYTSFNKALASALISKGINILELPINMQESKALHELLVC